MSTETKPSGLAKKLSAALAEIGRVEKRGHNQAQDYRFVRSDDVAEAARGVLAKHGIAIYPDVIEDGIREIVIPPAKEGFTGKTLRVSRVRVAWTFVDSETGEERTVHTPGEGMDSGDKGVYKAMTGAMKYLLMLSFLIPTGDGDPEKASDADEVYRDGKPAPASTAEKVKAKVAAAAKPSSKTPKDPEARKADIKARTMALGFTGAELAAKIAEWLGRPVDARTVFSEDDWLRVDVEILRAKENAQTLAVARNNVESAFGMNN